MKTYLKRFASIFVMVAMLVGLFSQMPLGVFAATVTHDVTGTVANNLSLTANYDVNMQATSFGGEAMTQDRINNNLLKMLPLTCIDMIIRP